MEDTRRGYPNPDYTEEDIGPAPEMMSPMIAVDESVYRQLVSKAAALDILTAHVKAHDEVSTEVVLAVTGLGKLNAEADRYYYWWVEESSKNQDLRKKVVDLEARIAELKAREGQTDEGKEDS